MTTFNTIIEEEKKRFDQSFWLHRVPRNTKQIADMKDFLITAMQRAYEAGGKEAVDYLRDTFKNDSEIGVNHLNVELDTLLSKITNAK